MTGIHICKTIKQKIYVVFYDMKCPKCSNLWIGTSKTFHVRYFILASASLYCIFHIIFKYHVLYFSLCISRTMYCIFHCVLLHCNFNVSVIDRTRKQTLLIKRFKFVFIKDVPSVSQSNVQAVTVENEEQHTLSNIISINLQDCYFFSLRSTLKEVLLKCKQTN